MSGDGLTQSNDMQVGEFLVQNGIITQAQLQDALELQKDNPDRLVGEVLVTQGILSREDLIMALEMYLMVTGREFSHVDEWLDQEEVDMIQERLNERGTQQ